MSEKGLESLRVHQMARDLVGYVYQNLVPILPDDEKWGLISQIRRAVISIPANIAEGYGRYYFQENIRFCYNARGSLEELFSHLLIASDLQYLSKNEFTNAAQKISDLRKALNGYIRFLKVKKENYAAGSQKVNLGENVHEGIYIAELDANSTDLID